MTDVGRDITRMLLESDPEAWAPILMPDGSARTTQWWAEDGWIIEYSTERVYGTTKAHAGKFVAMAYRPVGKGARGGRSKAQQWRRVYLRGFTTRKSAKARAMALYREHSPKWAARHPVRSEVEPR